MEIIYGIITSVDDRCNYTVDEWPRAGKNILTMYPHLKRLCMSGYTADCIAHHGVLDEGVHFIQKPFSLPNMATMVREVLDSN